MRKESLKKLQYPRDFHDVITSEDNTDETINLYIQSLIKDPDKNDSSSYITVGGLKVELNKCTTTDENIYDYDIWVYKGYRISNENKRENEDIINKIKGRLLNLDDLLKINNGDKVVVVHESSSGRLKYNILIRDNENLLSKKVYKIKDTLHDYNGILGVFKIESLGCEKDVDIYEFIGE